MPYFDIALDAGIVGMTPAEVKAVPWGVPAWATIDGQVLVGQAVWVAESDGRVVVVDPCGAADDFLRTGPEAVQHQERVRRDPRHGLSTGAGRRRRALSPRRIGMAAAADGDGGWQPCSPTRTVLMTRTELDWLAPRRDVSGLQALRALIDQGVVDGVDETYDVRGTPARSVGWHTPGHAILRAGSGTEQVVLVGHLAVSPLQDQRPSWAPRSPRLDLGTKLLAELVDEARADRSMLASPLWPAPGAAKVGPDGQLVPISAS